MEPTVSLVNMYLAIGSAVIGVSGTTIGILWMFIRLDRTAIVERLKNELAVTCADNRKYIYKKIDSLEQRPPHNGDWGHLTQKVDGLVSEVSDIKTDVAKIASHQKACVSSFN